jgi:serine/threonine-protein kinase HipA
MAEIMKVLLGAKEANADREQFFRSQILFWLLAATDGHAKNFSIHLETCGSHSLTPLYDVISFYISL